MPAQPPRTPLSSATDDARGARELAAIRQQERFNWFADRLADRIDAYTVDQLLEKLGSAPLWPGQWEKAVVMLALKADPEAVRALIDIDVSETSDSFKSLYEYCLAQALDAANDVA